MLQFRNGLLRIVSSAEFDDDSAVLLRADVRETVGAGGRAIGRLAFLREFRATHRRLLVALFRLAAESVRKRRSAFGIAPQRVGFVVRAHVRIVARPDARRFRVVDRRRNLHQRNQIARRLSPITIQFKCLISHFNSITLKLDSSWIK